MTADDQVWVHPRGEAWGNPPQRAVLRAIAEDVARRSRHRVCVIEVLRADGNLEFVAVAGNPAGEAALLGRSTPLALDNFLRHGTSVEGWLFVPEEVLDEYARAWMDEYGFTPDLPPSDQSDAWRAEDRLLRFLDGADSELRAIVYLDEPLSGRRPTPEVLGAVNAEVDQMLHAIVSIVERELYGEHLRMLTQVRAAIRSVGTNAVVGDYAAELATAMEETMQVDTVDVVRAGTTIADLEPDTAFLEAYLRRAWAEHTHLVVEPEESWGTGPEVVATPSRLSQVMERRGLGSWLLVPIGLGEDFLGALAMGRRRGGPRWTDGETSAAAMVAGELAGVLLDADLRSREREMARELREISDYRRDMVAVLAHELRNPVTVLWTQLQALGEEDVPGPVAEALHAMDRATRRIEDMVEDLMTLATVSDPAQRHHLVQLDLSVLVQEGLEFVAPVAAAGDLEVRTRVEPGMVVPGDPVGLQRMIANLLSNAIKYTPEGGCVEIDLVAEARGGRVGVLLRVTDDGLGIAAEEVTHLFTPFFRSADPQARRRPGTGLGLAIVEQVVDRHGGEVDVRSEHGVGTAFSVWLPSRDAAT